MKNYNKLTESERHNFINKVANMSVEELNDIIINQGKVVNPPIVTLNDSGSSAKEITISLNGREITLKSTDTTL